MTLERSASAERAPERRCVATGARLPKSELVRFVIGPDGNVVPDIRNKLPGRGVWVKSQRAALDKAIRKGIFSKHFRRHSTVPEDLADEVERQLAARVVEYVSLARKAGAAVAGFEKVQAELKRGTIALLLHARDGSKRQFSKLGTQVCNIERCGCLSSAELGMAFARGNVIYAALKEGALGSKTIEATKRLAEYRG